MHPSENREGGEHGLGTSYTDSTTAIDARRGWHYGNGHMQLQTYCQRRLLRRVDDVCHQLPTSIRSSGQQMHLQGVAILRLELLDQR